MRHLPHLKTRFQSVMVLRARLAKQLGEQVPKMLTFDVGYYEGQQHSKIWLCSDMDLLAIYQKIPSGEITFWCDAKSEEEPVVSKRKREDLSTGSSKRQKKEEVDFVFQELREKHGTIHLDYICGHIWSSRICMMTLTTLQIYQCSRQPLVNLVLLHFQQLPVELQHQ